MEQEGLNKDLYIMLPGVEYEELIYIKNLVENFDENNLQQFITIRIVAQ